MNQPATSAIAPYQSSTQHLRHELQRIDLMLQHAIARVRATVAPESADLRGVYVAEAEIDALLAGQHMIAPGFVAPAEADELVPPADLLALHDEIAARVAASREQNITLRLRLLAERFGLSAFELDAILICLLPELDLKYERIFGYLHDDMTRQRPSVDLVLNLLCGSLDAKLQARQMFAAEAPLRRQRLLELAGDPAQPQPMLLSTFLKLDEPIVAFLLGSDTLDQRLAPYATFADTSITQRDLLLPPDVQQRLAILSATPARATAGLVCYFQGAEGIGKQTAAAALSQAHGQRLLVLDGERLLNSGGQNSQDLPGFVAALRLVCREATLHNAALYWQGFDMLLTDEYTGCRELLLRELGARPGWSFLAGRSMWEPSNTQPDQRFVRIEFRTPGAAERQQLWARALDGVPCADDLDLAALANVFRLSARQITDAASAARNMAQWRDPAARQVDMADLYSACRLQSNRSLGALARNITPQHTWADLVLPADRLAHLREIALHLKYRTQVYEHWGFGRKLALGKGLTIMFAGPSGTGKTMAASIIAGELGLEMYKIDLSLIISKYIGETEKNLGRIFTEAESSNAILFFDEADALFGKRSEVRDAHDRYANVETSYLLQRMEEYDGVVILATNLRKNMDDAFVRRMQFTVEFPLPAEPERRRIWDTIWPADLPCDPELDLDFMARRFEVAGGNIRNIALATAFLAAADGGTVRMAHLLHATRREYQKMGKMVSDREFGEYAGLIETR